MIFTATNARIFLIVVLGSLAIRSLRQQPIPLSELRRRLPRCVIGLAFFAIGIMLQVQSKLGLGPWDVLHTGLAKRIGLDFGLVNNLLGLCVLPLWFPLKQRIGLGTVMNTLEIGLLIDLIKRNHLLPAAQSLPVQIAFMVLGVLFIAGGSGLYIGCGLGPGPRDGLMVGLKRLGLSVRVARTLIEATVFLLGYLLGGKVGVGTVFFFVTIGPLAQIALARLTLPPLAPVPSPRLKAATS
jgi:uncharacterized membrane protein YczE